ncbi:hypothetical protein CLV85_0583 [Salinibacterium amurskyense]|uniref:Uncharacterized protein n=1 Tax=Salinibacterium amurskyense TaxID=205941 RepID=A0A2M9D6R0_9MICO|nr:hypothetical protein CLV85_0583 [Salinibacterium amurskyense]
MDRKSSRLIMTVTLVGLVVLIAIVTLVNG